MLQARLAVKIAVLIVVVLIIGFGASTILTIQREADLLVEQSKMSARRLTATLVASIEGAMLQERPDVTRAAIQVRRQALVTSVMDFDAKEAEAFWPLYREYRAAMATVNDRYVKLVVAYLDTYKALSDDAATGMLKEYLSIERARTDVKSEYVPRFGKVITAKKVARFFQVDNKLDAVINADMARLIPLAR